LISKMSAKSDPYRSSTRSVRSTSLLFPTTMSSCTPSATIRSRWIDTEGFSPTRAEASVPKMAAE